MDHKMIILGPQEVLFPKYYFGIPRNFPKILFWDPKIFFPKYYFGIPRFFSQNIILGIPRFFAQNIILGSQFLFPKYYFGIPIFVPKILFWVMVQNHQKSPKIYKSIVWYHPKTPSF
jgi:hypothetical protein